MFLMFFVAMSLIIKEIKRPDLFQFFSTKTSLSTFNPVPEFDGLNRFIEQAKFEWKASGDLKAEIGNKMHEIFYQINLIAYAIFTAIEWPISTDEQWQPLLEQVAKRVREQDGKRL